LKLRIVLLIASVCLWLPSLLAAAEPTAAAVRKEVDRVYALPEFNPQGDEYSNFILKWLRDLFEWLGRLAGTSPLIYWSLLISLILILALLIGHIVYVVMSAIRIGRAEARAAAAGRVERQRLSAHHREEADRNAAAREYTQAVRSLFLSLVYAFDEAGRLPFVPSLTNHEYLNFFADRPAVRASLGVFVDLLDDNWYGQHPTSRQQYEECLDHYQSVRNQRA